MYFLYEVIDDSFIERGEYEYISDALFASAEMARRIEGIKGCETKIVLTKKNGKNTELEIMKLKFTIL